MIRLEGVSRVYGAGAGQSVALRDVTLQIGKGEFAAIAGPSGSGKTTLLNLIGAIDHPSSGSVFIDGQNIQTLSQGSMADLRLTRIGFVFQHYNLIPVLSTAENIEFPLLFRRDLSARERRDRVARVIDCVELSGKVASRPDELSGGEKQRVAVARALAGEPSIVLADEPTANLDHETGRSVIQLMAGLNQERGITFLYATHDPELIRLADRVLTLRDGLLIGEGP